MKNKIDTNISAKQQDDLKIGELWSELRSKLGKKEFELEEVDIIWEKISKILKQDTSEFKEEKLIDLRNKRWTFNHIKIKQAIYNHVSESNAMPSAFDIAVRTGLSRQTVSKHLREFETSDLFNEEMKAYVFASNMLLGKILAMGAQGDFKAMKFYISIMERRQQGKLPMTTNNFIQVNNIYVNEDTIKALPEDKRNAIEEIILSENLKLKLPT